MKVNSMSINSTALAAPGAGIPTLEKWIARSLLWWMRHRQPPEQWFTRFANETVALHRLVDLLSDAQGAHQVIITRPRGIEDSSRDWSVWMTFDHLRIVNVGITGIIQSLTQQKDPDIIVRIEDVKPQPGVGREVLVDYEASCRILLTIARENWHRSAVPIDGPTHSHPWFGPIDAATWFCLATGHLGLHREQIRRILSTVNRRHP